MILQLVGLQLARKECLQRTLDRLRERVSLKSLLVRISSDMHSIDLLPVMLGEMSKGSRI